MSPQVVTLTSIVVNLNKSAHGPIALPPSFTAFARIGGGDTVHFQSHYPFTITFKDDSPFDWDTEDGVPANGLYALEGTIREDALPDGVEEKRFEYGMTVDGVPVDPDVVVKKDPQGNA